MKKRWYVLGAGAIGCLWASRMLKGGVDVTLLCRTEEKSKLLTASGITVEFTSQAEHFTPATTVVSESGPLIENLLITTKATDTVAAFTNLLHRINSDTCILLLQNGMGNYENLTATFPTNNLFVGTTTEGAYKKSENHIVHAGTGETNIGSLHPYVDQAGKDSLTTMMQATQLEWQWLDKIEPFLWQKLIINGGINALTVIHQCCNGDLLTNAEASQTIKAFAKEITALSFIQQQGWSQKALEEKIRSVAEKTAKNYSSSYQDIQQGRKTEISYINGYLAKVAEREGITLSINQSLLSRVQEIESKLDHS